MSILDVDGICLGCISSNYSDAGYAGRASRAGAVSKGWAGFVVRSSRNSLAFDHRVVGRAGGGRGRRNSSMSTTGALLLFGWRKIKGFFGRGRGGGGAEGCASTGGLHGGAVTEGAGGCTCAARSARVGPARGFLDGWSLRLRRHPGGFGRERWSRVFERKTKYKGASTLVLSTLKSVRFTLKFASSQVRKLSSSQALKFASSLQPGGGSCSLSHYY